MMFIAGMGLGAIVTMGIAFIFAADKNIVDEGDDEWYT
jgi:hypothetical protein